MARVIKVLVVLLILHGTVRAAYACWEYYRFRDAVENAVRYAVDDNEGQLVARILTLASTYQIPLPGENLEVRKDQTAARTETTVSGAYVAQIEVFPRYRYPHEFRFTVHASAVKPQTAESLEMK